MLWCLFISIVLVNDAMGQNVPSTDWISDSYSSFDVVLSGTGPGWFGTITSPSGLWQLDSVNEVEPVVNDINNQTDVQIANFGTATFIGQFPSQYIPPSIAGNDPSAPGVAIGTFGGYQDEFPPVAPIHDGNNLDAGYLIQLGGHLVSPPPGEVVDPSLDWHGSSTISVTSIPDVNDASTWTWNAEYYASGGSLEEIPEPTTLALAGLSAALMLLLNRISLNLIIASSRVRCAAHTGRKLNWRIAGSRAR